MKLLAETLLELTNATIFNREYEVKAKVDSILEDIEVLATVAAAKEETEMSISTFPTTEVDIHDLYQEDKPTELGKAVLDRLAYEGFDASFHSGPAGKALWLSWANAFE